jgi:hypothetical protein
VNGGSRNGRPTRFPFSRHEADVSAEALAQADRSLSGENDQDHSCGERRKKLETRISKPETSGWPQEGAEDAKRFEHFAHLCG